KIDIVTFFDQTRSNNKNNEDIEKRWRESIDIDDNIIEKYSLLSNLDEEVFNRAIVAKLVKKVGKPDYLGDFTKDVVHITNTFIDRIKTILEDENNKEEINIFNSFVEELRDDLNDSLTDDEVIEMLAQHMITGPAFDALFENNSFIKNNPVSISIEKVLKAFNDHHLEKETQGLGGFYDSVRKEVEIMQDKVSGIDNIIGKQKIIVELYEKFFKDAFPKMTQRLGIVYTPVEIVDFIIKSVNELLQKEFEESFGSKNVHIIDPFTGTGTFITRLLQSGFIDKKDLQYKYMNEIHANEIVLLAYYIASINIESIYHEIRGGDNYEIFPGICLTDTFQLYEKDDLISHYLEDNSTRRKKQKAIPLRVIIGNPPYSVGQKSQNDNNKKVRYPKLDQKIKLAYVKNSNAQNSKGMFDSYIRAFYWASERLRGDVNGIVAFVTNSSHIQKPTMDGLRKSFAKEFQKIYVLNLRGDIRQNSLNSVKNEGDNIFADKSKTGIAITFLVKNSNSKEDTKIYYYDIGDNLKREEKLNIINTFGSISGIEKEDKFIEVIPNEKGDWISHRNFNMYSFISLGDKKKKEAIKIFGNYSCGVFSNRDSWCFNFSYDNLVQNVIKMIDFYNSERKRFHETFPVFDYRKIDKMIDNFVNNDPRNISWSRSLKRNLKNNINLIFDDKCIVKSTYRPFTKSYFYSNKTLNENLNQIPKIFPEQNINNLVICVSGVGARSGFSVLMSDEIPHLELVEKAQCFPIYLYNRIDSKQEHSKKEAFLFQVHNPDLKYKKYQAITDEGLKYFQEAYPQLIIQRLDLFYYIYGLLHSSQYREMFGNNLAKELPRIPRVKSAKDFLDFSEAGKKLAKLHLDYDNVRKYPVEIISGDNLSIEDYYVTRMVFKQKYGKKDYSTIIYNSKITIKGIPLRAYDYIVTGKTAIEWIMKSQGVDTHSKSGIVNDANIWAKEVMNNPKYPLELLQRVITVSLETLDIVENLPKLSLI
ncbi:MAG: N-6 DNA methylase, partial [Clostridiales Family XIII bacterium]|nr:N-6 DNA methylase [Clostridiales Family XIII bacterium]